jgi:hypothetical protein
MYICRSIWTGWVRMEEYVFRVSKVVTGIIGGVLIILPFFQYAQVACKDIITFRQFLDF